MSGFAVCPGEDDAEHMQEGYPHQGYGAPVMDVAEHFPEEQALLEVQYRVIGVLR
jgi:hypothetical protein